MCAEAGATVTALRVAVSVLCMAVTVVSGRDCLMCAEAGAERDRVRAGRWGSCPGQDLPWGVSDPPVQRFRGGLVFQAHRLVYHSQVYELVHHSRVYVSLGIRLSHGIGGLCFGSVDWRVDRRYFQLYWPPRVQGNLAHKELPPPLGSP